MSHRGTCPVLCLPNEPGRIRREYLSAPHPGSRGLSQDRDPALSCSKPCCPLLRTRELCMVFPETASVDSFIHSFIPQKFIVLLTSDE